jgi:hypothetical protein
MHMDMHMHMYCMCSVQPAQPKHAFYEAQHTGRAPQALRESRCHDMTAAEAEVAAAEAEAAAAAAAATALGHGKS